MTVPSVRKALQVLELVARREQRIGTSEIGRELGLAKSTVHGLCSTLADMGFLIKDEESQYRMGPQSLVLAQGYARTIDPIRNFTSEAAKVEAFDEETLVLAVLDGPDVIYVATRRGRQNIAISYDVGLRLPAYCTSTGKALLSMLPESQVKDLLAGHSFRAMTPNSIRDLETLLSELRTARDVGYSTDDEETAIGMYCIASAITNGRGRPVAAVSVTTVKASLTDEKIRLNRQAIRQLAASLSLGPIERAAQSA